MHDVLSFRLAVVVIAIETKSLEHNEKLIGEQGNEHTLCVDVRCTCFSSSFAI